MELDDKPGELVEVGSVIASLGGNITGVHHDRYANRNKVNACVLRVTMETRDEEHVKESIASALLSLSSSAALPLESGCKGTDFFPFLQLLPHTFLQYFFRILSNSLIFFML